VTRVAHSKFLSASSLKSDAGGFGAKPKPTVIVRMREGKTNANGSCICALLCLHRPLLHSNDGYFLCAYYKCVASAISLPRCSTKIRTRGFSMAQSTAKIEHSSTVQHISVPPKQPSSYRWLRRLAPLGTILFLLAVWQVIFMLELYPSFIIPAPFEVWDAFLTSMNDGTLPKHMGVTLSEMLLGLFFGLSIGAILGYAIAHIQWLEDLLSPITVAFQATPVVAYAPLLIIWFRDGITGKVIITAIIVFFPTLMNVIVGIRNVPINLHDLMRVMKASRLQIFLKLEVPAALPVLLTGFKTSVTLAVIGAVVGEFVNASEGLGFLIVVARSQYKTPLVFVAMFTMTALALSLYFLVSMLEWFLLKWQRQSR
jgi:ABC-type nitrate/sulfonate/bicarbonate transport system permease component